MDLLSCFRTETARLIGRDGQDGDRYGIAVSGGPDSLALLLLAHAAFPGCVAAATVDHGLRAESAGEAERVARYCDELNIPHRVLHPDQPITGSLHVAARAVRYALLDDWRRDMGIAWLMTGHHADDQLETILMRLNRASGVAGLAAIRGRQGCILRPLLHVRRADLAHIVRQRGWNAIEDPSNEDARFDRARMRAALATMADIVDPCAAAISADALAAANAALDWMTDALAQQRIRSAERSATIDIESLPDELVRRLLVRGLALVDPARAPPRGEALSRAITALLAGEQTMLGDVILTRSHDNLLVLRQSAARRHRR